MKQIDSTGRARRAARALVVLMVLLALPACYDFPAPLDPEPRMKLDTRLLGAWLCLPPEPTLPPSLRIQASEDDQLIAMTFEASGPRYRIRLVGFDKPGEESLWEGYESRLADHAVLNLRGTPDDGQAHDAGVTLAAFRFLAPNLVQFDLIDDKPVKGKPLSPSSELRKTLLSHRPQSELFSPFMVCVRAKIEDPS